MFPPLSRTTKLSTPTPTIYISPTTLNFYWNFICNFLPQYPLVLCCLHHYLHQLLLIFCCHHHHLCKNLSPLLAFYFQWCNFLQHHPTIILPHCHHLPTTLLTPLTYPPSYLQRSSSISTIVPTALCPCRYHCTHNYAYHKLSLFHTHCHHHPLNNSPSMP